MSGKFCDDCGINLGLHTNGACPTVALVCSTCKKKACEGCEHIEKVIARELAQPDEILYQTGQGTANAQQVGGAHCVNHTIQPWDAIVDWGLGFLDGNVVKYVARFRHKGGVEDLKKARHYLDKLIEVESK